MSVNPKSLVEKFIVDSKGRNRLVAATSVLAVFTVLITVGVLTFPAISVSGSDEALQEQGIYLNVGDASEDAVAPPADEDPQIAYDAVADAPAAAEGEEVATAITEDTVIGEAAAPEEVTTAEDAADIYSEEATDAPVADVVEGEDYVEYVEGEDAEVVAEATDELVAEEVIDPELEAEDPAAETETDPEAEEEELVYSAAAEEALAAADLSSNRLIVSTNDVAAMQVEENVVASFDNIYLIQYANTEDTIKGFLRYFDNAEYVTPDVAVEIAEGEDNSDPQEEVITTDNVYTEETNPFTELEIAVEENQEAIEQEAQMSDALVAVIDTGADLSDNVIEAVSMLGEDASDENGHGNRMVGFIVEENEAARILSIKALGPDGKGDVSAVVAAINYAIERGANIINLSMSAYASEENAALADAVKRAEEVGVIVVGSAGNNGFNAKFYIPGNIEEATIVGASDDQGVRIVQSNFGETVDYNVFAGSTSEAAARLSGFVSAYGEGAIAEVLNQGRIFTTDYVAPVVEEDEIIEEETEEAPETEEDTDTQLAAAALEYTTQKGAEQANGADYAWLIEAESDHGYKDEGSGKARVYNWAALDYVISTGNYSEIVLDASTFDSLAAYKTIEINSSITIKAEGDAVKVYRDSDSSGMGPYFRVAANASLNLENVILSGEIADFRLGSYLSTDNTIHDGTVVVEFEGEGYEVKLKDPNGNNHWLDNYDSIGSVQAVALGTVDGEPDLENGFAIRAKKKNKDGDYLYLGVSQGKPRAETVAPDKVSTTTNKPGYKWELVHTANGTYLWNQPGKLAIGYSGYQYEKPVTTNRSEVIPRAGEVYGSSLTNYDSASRGYFIYSEGALVLENATLQNASCGPAVASKVGAPIVATGGTVELKGSTVIDKNLMNFGPTADAAGDSLLANSRLNGSAGALILENTVCTITDNVRIGAASVDDHTDMSAWGNKYPGNKGTTGAIAVRTGATLNMDGQATINGNRGLYAGGVLVVGTGATFNMRNGTISNNYAEELKISSYGARVVAGGGVTVYGNLRNGAADQSGAFNFGVEGDAESNPRIEHNDSFTVGGGVYVCSDKVKLVRGTIDSNKAALYGGGVYVYGRSDNNGQYASVLQIEDAEFINNGATFSGKNSGYFANVTKERFPGSEGNKTAEDSRYFSGIGDAHLIQYKYIDKMLPGSGGGIWLCPEGTVVFDAKNVLFNGNWANVQGNDLHKDNGFAGGFTARFASGSSFRTDNFDGHSTYVSSSETRNNRTGEPFAPKYFEDNPFVAWDLHCIENGTPDKQPDLIISNNISRRGGGLGSDGILILSEKTTDIEIAKGVLRLEKKFENHSPEPVAVTVDLEYKDDNGDDAVYSVGPFQLYSSDDVLVDEDGNPINVEDVTVLGDISGQQLDLAGTVVYGKNKNKLQIVLPEKLGDKDVFVKDGTNYVLNESLELNIVVKENLSGYKQSTSAQSLKTQRRIYPERETNVTKLVFDTISLSMNLTNEYIERDIQVKKVDQVGRPLPGATFKLFNIDNQEIKNPAVEITNDGTVFTWKKMPAGRYRIEETIAPGNAVAKAESLWIKITDEGEIQAITDPTVPVDVEEEYINWPLNNMRLEIGNDWKLRVGGIKLYLDKIDGDDSQGNNLTTTQNNLFPLSLFDVRGWYVSPNGGTNSVRLEAGQEYYMVISDFTKKGPNNSSAGDHDTAVLMSRKYNNELNDYDYAHASLIHEVDRFFLLDEVRESYPWPVHLWECVDINGTLVLRAKDKTLGPERYLALTQDGPRLVSTEEMKATRIVQALPTEDRVLGEGELPANIKIEKQGDISSIAVSNTVKYGVTVYKTNGTASDDNALPGATFALYDSDDKLVAEKAALESNEFSFEGLLAGDYYFMETVAPEGYDGIEGKIPFTLADDGTVSQPRLANASIDSEGYLCLGNRRLYYDDISEKDSGKLSLTKGDKGSAIRIKRFINGSPGGAYLTQGDINTSDTYALALEDKPGYYLQGRHYRDGSFHHDRVRYEQNSWNGGYYNWKFESVNGMMVIKSTLDNNNHRYLYFNGTEECLSTELAGLKDGTAVEFDDNAASFTVPNTRITASLSIHKTDQSGNNIVNSGARFTFNGESEERPVDANGILSITGLLSGTYTLQETTPPSGYDGYGQVIKLAIDNNGNVKQTGLADVSLREVNKAMLDGYHAGNDKEYQVVLGGKPLYVKDYGTDNASITTEQTTYPVVLRTGGKPAATVEATEGKVYRMLAVNQNIKSSRGSGEDAADYPGIALWNGKPNTEAPFNWSVEEIAGALVLKSSNNTYLYLDGDEVKLLPEAQSNILIDSKTVTYNSADRTFEVKVKNVKHGYVKLFKKNGGDNTPLPNATLEIISKKTGLTVATWVSTDNANGSELFELPVGDYTLVETSAPEGFLYAPAQDFTVTSDHTTELPLELTMVDTPDQPQTVTVRKVDSSSNGVVVGAKLQVQYPDGRPVEASWNPITTDGTDVVIEGLEPGQYQLVEIEAPEGYLLNPNPVPFTVAWKSWSNKGSLAGLQPSINYGSIVPDVHMMTLSTADKQNIAYCIDKTNITYTNEANNSHATTDYVNLSTGDIAGKVNSNYAQQIQDNRDEIKKVLYYGYPNDAANLIASMPGATQQDKEQAFWLITQLAIWHYTNDDSNTTGNDTYVYGLAQRYVNSEQYNRLIEIAESDDYTINDSNFDVSIFMARNNQPVIETYPVGSSTVEVCMDNSRERGELIVEKKWLDASGNALSTDDARIPDFINVVLMRKMGTSRETAVDDEAFNAETVAHSMALAPSTNEALNWKATFTDLEIMDSEGNYYYYYIVEPNPGNAFTAELDEPVITYATKKVRSATPTYTDVELVEGTSGGFVNGGTYVIYVPDGYANAGSALTLQSNGIDVQWSSLEGGASTATAASKWIAETDGSGAFYLRSAANQTKYIHFDNRLNQLGSNYYLSLTCLDSSSDYVKARFQLTDTNGVYQLKCVNGREIEKRPGSEWFISSVGDKLYLDNPQPIKVSEFSYTSSESGATVDGLESKVEYELTNKAKTYEFELVKVDARALEDIEEAIAGKTEVEAKAEIIRIAAEYTKLANVEFELHTTDGSETNVANATSDENGVISFQGINPGSYKLVEMRAYEHYVMTTGLWWTIDVATDGNITVKSSFEKDGSDYWTAQVDTLNIAAIGNEAEAYILPATGGIGTHVFVIAGVILMLVAGALFVRRTSRQKA